MQMTNELHRRPSPVERPAAIAWFRGLLWVSSRESNHVYALDPQSLAIRETFEAPGKPFGIAPVGDDLRVVIGIGDDDDRYFFRLVPGRGFDPESKVACPDLTGSYVAVDGSTFYLCQLHYRRILALDADNNVQRRIALPTDCAGIGVDQDGRFFMIAMIEDENEHEYLQLGRLDVTTSEPAFELVMPLPDEARSIVHDGTQWWTCLRDIDEIAQFSVHE